MRRRLLRILFVTVFAIVAAGLGTLTALVTVPPGKDLLARLVTEESNRLVRGSVSIGRIRGDFLTGLQLDSVVIRDTAGSLLADVPRLEIRFRLADLLAKRFLFHSVQATGIRLEVVKHRGGRMNYQEILKLNEGPPGTGPGTLLQLDELRIVDGTVTVRTPWNPDGRLRTDRQRDSALAAERAKPGRRIEPAERPSDGLVAIRTLERVNAHFPTMRISSPDRKPFSATIGSLAARVSDPGLTVVDLRGEIVQGADSLLFDLERAALPNTVTRGKGRIDWPQDTLLYQFELAASRLDLVDLRWVSPDFPALQGRGRVVARSLAGSRTEYDIRDLDVRDASSRVAGRLVAILDVHRGLGFRDLALDLGNLDLEAVRPYLDTLPLRGRISGPLEATGFFDAMTVRTDWRFDDARVEGGGANLLALEGDLTLGGPDGMVFHGARITRSDLDLRTIRLVTPAVALDGRLALAGRLEGPWRDVVYEGRVEHQDGDRPRSALTGRARLDTRGAILGLDARLTIDTLWFDGIRPSFPTTPMLGRIGGSLALAGRLDSLRVEGDLRGEIGRYRFAGLTAMQPPRWAARDLRVDFEGANLAMLSPGGPPTRLDGRLDLTGRIDTLVAPEAAIDLHLGRGVIREVAFDSARARLAIRDSLITIDTALVRWEGGGGSAAGTLGWDQAHPGRLRFGAVALSLAPFDSLAAATLGVQRVELGEETLLSGRARAAGTIAGSLDRWELVGDARADSVDWLSTRVRVGTGTYRVVGGRSTALTMAVKAAVDTVVRPRMVFAGLAADLEGRPEDLAWAVRGSGGSASAAAGGRWRRTNDVRTVGLDSLRLDILGRSWRLDRPASFTIDVEAVADSLSFATDDGSGVIRLAGALPGRSAAGDLEIQALGIALKDLYALAQRDTTGIGGTVGVDLRVAGTLADPNFRGSATITGPVVGDVKAPLVRTVFDYRDRVFQSNLSFWRTGRPILDVDATLPLDLSLRAVDRRQLPGPLVIRARADSVDLGVIEALTPNVRGVVGNLAVDATVGGTWDAPRLGGSIRVSDGALFVPGLGVSYGPFDGRVRLVGDSIVADSVVIRSGIGRALVSGGLRLDRLTRPLLDLRVSAADFALIDVPDYLTLRATGDVALSGAIERPLLTGEVRATSSVLYFADLITKDIINLEDPLNADLVDTTVLRAQKLRAQFQSRFLDSLTIRDLRFRVSQDVWLRSSEANVQLEGQVTVNKERRRAGRSEFRVSGQFTTPRGSYTMKLGPVFRTFAVEQGTVQYFNTPDLNAALDLSARYVVRTVTGGGTDDYPVIARITGTLLVPKLALTSEAGRQPLPERDLVSLLVFGTTTNTVLGGGATFNEQQIVASIAATALSSELERSLISSPDAPFDLIEIRPGFAQGNTAFSTAGSVTTLSLGRQLSRRLFVTFNLGGCVNAKGVELNRQYLGATLEYRLHPTLKFQIAGEPVQSCLGDISSSLTRPSRYQFGAGLKWDREY